MKLFRCQNCNNGLHFDNTVCLRCGHAVGYLQNRFEMSAIERRDGGWYALADPTSLYAFCDNARYGVCNWLISQDAKLCESCRHNHVIPDLSSPENLRRWGKIELAKRYLFRSLLRWRLPMPDRLAEPTTGLAFDLKQDANDGSKDATVLTGHDDGLITLNIAEADDDERERRRTAMGEPFRTLLGHLRHEIGHYYWDRLVRDGGQLESCRQVFGDERADYNEALKKHYANGAPANWSASFISAYATSHPWEDFAETWAHYLHIVDALETALSYGINVEASFAGPEQHLAPNFDPYRANSATQLMDAWAPLTVAINGVNRSMGQPDLYPFVVSPPVVAKLEYIRGLVASYAGGG